MFPHVRLIEGPVDSTLKYFPIICIELLRKFYDDRSYLEKIQEIVFMKSVSGQNSFKVFGLLDLW